jgi:hypothetical protein
MEAQARRQNLPNIGELSVLAAMIVLTYTLARFISLPSWQISNQLPGLYIELTIDVNLITSVLVACMTAAGANWLMRSHPAAQGKQSIVHAILPALTALVIGIPLGGIPVGLGWWLGLVSGAFILVLVLIAEYIAVDPRDVRFPFASGIIGGVICNLPLFAGALRAAGVFIIQCTSACICGMASKPESDQLEITR